MTEREQIRDLRERTYSLDRSLDRTFKRMCQKERECVALRQANGDILTTLEATDVLLGAAMDCLLSGGEQ